MFKKLLNSATGAAQASKDSMQGLIESHWPAIQAKVGPTLAKIAEGHLQDEAHVKQLLESAHAMLPLPIRLVIRQATFIEYFQTHKEKLLTLSQSHKKPQLPNSSTVDVAGPAIADKS